MGILQSSAALIEARAEHAEQVDLVAQGGTPAQRIDVVSSSWQRCLTQHGVNPIDDEAPRILTARELRDLRQPLEDLISSARDEIDRLYNWVREAGYTLLFCDRTGVVVEHRADDADASHFKHWGIWLGALWSEEAEGTNGIGTCTTEERPLTVHRSQHFRSRHIGLSCSGAPIFGVDGQLIAVLDVSTFDPELSERAHALTGPLTVTAARAMEERSFRERFRREWIVATSAHTTGVPTMLLAVDSDQRIVGANRAARISLLLDDCRLLTGVSLWSLFERDHALFRRKDATDIPARLMIAGSSENYPALITPPESSWQNKTNPSLHTRPRSDLLGAIGHFVPVRQGQGGLPPSAMRRVRDYVETHLSENIDLAALASIAGLSVFHFAREFKRSSGDTPHHYVVRKRVERAQDMLARSDLTLAEIAIAAGFTDQSHLSRHFRQMLGTTPRGFRQSLL